MLSFRKKDKDKSEKQDVIYEHPIITLISGKLIEVEENMIRQLKRNDKSELIAQGKEYKKELFLAASKLSKISSVCFQNAEIDEVKIYKDDSLMPVNYSRYTQAQKNITKLVADDISNQHDINHAVIHLERWVYILKLCSERNDYFTAGAITYALFSINENLINSISDVAKSIISYNKQIYMRQNKLHILQLRQSKEKRNVIPLLSTLANTLANAEATGDEMPKEELDILLNDCKSIYITMKENHKKSQLTKESQEEKALVCLQNEIQILEKSSPVDSKKASINMNVLTTIVNIYEKEDIFYYYVQKLEALNSELCKMDADKFNETDARVYNEVKKALGQSHVCDADRLQLINNILKNNCTMDKKLIKRCNEIVVTLENLSNLNLKRIALETRTFEKHKHIRKHKQRNSSSSFKIESEKEGRIRSAPTKLTRSTSNACITTNIRKRPNLNNLNYSASATTISIQPNRDIVNGDNVIKPVKSESTGKQIHINLTVNIEDNNTTNQTMEISINLPKFNQGFFTNSQNDSMQPKMVSKKDGETTLIRTDSHAEKVTKSQTLYTKSQLPGLLLINDEVRASRIMHEQSQNKFQFNQ